MDVRFSYTLDLDTVGKERLREQDDSWAKNVYVRRKKSVWNYAREAFKNVQAARILIGDTTRSEAVFDFLGTFPVQPILAASGRRLPSFVIHDSWRCGAIDRCPTFA